MVLVSQLQAMVSFSSKLGNLIGSDNFCSYEGEKYATGHVKESFHSFNYFSFLRHLK